MPAPMPLPNPRMHDTTVRLTAPDVSGMASSDRPITTIDGTVTHRRPRTSITLPAG